MPDKALNAAIEVLWQNLKEEEERKALEVLAAYLTLNSDSYIIEVTCATKNLGISLETLTKLANIGFLKRERETICFASNEIRTFVKNKMGEKRIA